jgi:hypothetical protein
MNFETIDKCSKDFNETKDCAVKAVSLVTGVHYADVLALMDAKGRKPRKGTPMRIIYATLKHLGYTTVKIDTYDAKTVRTLERQMRHTKGTYLVWVRKHILAVVDGNVIDWTQGRRHRVITVERVIRK